MNLGFIELGQMGRPMLERLKGTGHRVKAYNRTRFSPQIARNFLLATMIESLGEAFALVRKCGVAPADFLSAIANTSLGSPAYRNYGKMIVEQAWSPAQFAMPLGVKDLELALSTAKDAGMRLPSGEMIREHLLLAGHIAARAGL